MTELPSSPPSTTETQLFSLVMRERMARDTNEWETLESLYWPDAVVRVTWFTGSPRDFVEQSRATVRPGAVRGMHRIVPARAEIAAARALVESQGAIILRPKVDGVECDLVNLCRFFSRAERRDGEWRLASFDSIYGKDRIDPVVPGEVPAVDQDALAAGRVSYRWLTYTNHQRGFPVPQDLPGDDRPDLLDQFYAEARAWLHQA